MLRNHEEGCILKLIYQLKWLTSVKFFLRSDEIITYRYFLPNEWLVACCKYGMCMVAEEGLTGN
jgi:hypothetical protein